MEQFRFRKTDRLSGKKKIDKLFLNGNSLFIAPFRVLWLGSKVYAGGFHARVVISVPKKYIKRAVKRNLIKRRIREAYRKNRSELVEYLKKKDINLDMFLIYTYAQILSYRDIEKKIILLLRKITKENEKDSD